jgi:hypothetical protein
VGGGYFHGGLPPASWCCGLWVCCVLASVSQEVCHVGASITSWRCIGTVSVVIWQRLGWWILVQTPQRLSVYSKVRLGGVLVCVYVRCCVWEVFCWWRGGV